MNSTSRRRVPVIIISDSEDESDSESVIEVISSDDSMDTLWFNPLPPNATINNRQLEWIGPLPFDDSEDDAAAPAPAPVPVPTAQMPIDDLEEATTPPVPIPSAIPKDTGTTSEAVQPQRKLSPAAPTQKVIKKTAQSIKKAMDVNGIDQAIRRGKEQLMKRCTKSHSETSSSTETSPTDNVIAPPVVTAVPASTESTTTSTESLSKRWTASVQNHAPTAPVISAKIAKTAESETVSEKDVATFTATASSVSSSKKKDSISNDHQSTTSNVTAAVPDVNNLPRIPKLALFERKSDPTTSASPLNYENTSSPTTDPKEVANSVQKAPKRNPRKRTASEASQCHRIRHAEEAGPEIVIPPKAPGELKSILKKTSNSNDANGKKRVVFGGTQCRYIESRKTEKENIIYNTETPSVPNGVHACGLEDEIISAFLKWNPHWFAEAKRLRGEHQAELPPIAQDWSLLPIQSSYESLQLYFDTHKFLLLHEIWEYIFRQYLIMPFDDREELGCRVVHVASDGGNLFKFFSVAGLVEKEKMQQLRNDMFLQFRLHVDNTNLVFFGLVTEISSHRCRRLEEIIPELRKNAKVTKDNVKQFFSLSMKICVRSKTNLPSCEKYGPIMLQLICDLAPMTRLTSALEDLGSSFVQSMILTPSRIPRLPTTPQMELLTCKNSTRYNESQLQAISTCMTALKVYDGPVIQVVDCPDEPARVQTIVGLVEEIHQMKIRDRMNGIVLVVAPHGETVDNLSRGILGMNKQHSSRCGEKFLKFVRLGQRAGIAQDVARYSIDEFVETNIRNEESTAAGNNDAHQAATMEQIARLRGQMQTITESQPNEEQIAHLEQLHQQIEELRRAVPRPPVTFPQDRTSGKFIKYECKLRKKLIAYADVVACTLNIDGEDFDLLKDMHSREATILCTIMDDASKALEIETLLVTYRPMSKIFLFGDSRKDPPHALSQVANQYGFGNSLFGRICSNFNGEATSILKVLAN